MTIYVVTSLGQLISSDFNTLLNTFSEFLISKDKPDASPAKFQEWLKPKLRDLRLGAALNTLYDKFLETYQLSPTDISFTEFQRRFNSMSLVTEPTKQSLRDLQDKLSTNYEHVKFVVISHTNYSHFPFILNQITSIFSEGQLSAVNDESWQNAQIIFSPSMMLQQEEHADIVKSVFVHGNEHIQGKIDLNKDNDRLISCLDRITPNTVPELTELTSEFRYMAFDELESYIKKINSENRPSSSFGSGI